jgi:hypothetical protein
MSPTRLGGSRSPCAGAALSWAKARLWIEIGRLSWEMAHACADRLDGRCDRADLVLSARVVDGDETLRRASVNGL